MHQLLTPPLGAMAGLFKLARSLLVSRHLILVFLVALVMPVAKASSLSSFWQHELPHTSMPKAVERLASPLSPSRTQEFLTQLKAGTSINNDDFCSSAGIYCSKKAIVRGPQPRVCIPPYFNYAYGILPCRDGAAASASAVQEASRIFFSQGSLEVGQLVQLPDTSNELKGFRFLPHPLAEAMPELKELSKPKLMKFYGVEKGSDMELDMENTLAHCAYKSDHEVRACQTSGEGMVSFITKEIGHNAVVYAPSAIPKQEATVMDIATVSSQGDKVAACHDMKFPSLVYSCHATQSSQLMDVSVKLADGHVAHMPAVCHMDTSYWSPSHIAFQVLDAEPGKSSICHWFPENSFIFVQAANE